MNTNQATRRADPRQAGFTLIELIMVIVILGILAAVAVPKFTDLSSDAELAAANGVLGACNSQASITFATNKAQSKPPSFGKTAVLDTLMEVPTGWTATATTLTHTGKDSKTYTITVTPEAEQTKGSCALTVS